MIFEINIKDENDLDIWVDKIRHFSNAAFSITNKTNKIDRLRFVEKLQKKLGRNLGINLVYSIRVNGVRSRNMAIQLWDSFLVKAIHHNLKKILIVSGVPKYKHFTSLDALSFAVKYREFGISLGVAFNPFLASDEEYKLLRQKVNTGMVSSIYFQLGDNYLLLKKGLSFCNKHFPKIPKFVSILHSPSKLYSSVQRQSWHGVFFSQKFLSNPESAIAINEKLLTIAREYDAEIYLSGYIN